MMPPGTMRRSFAPPSIHVRLFHESPCVSEPAAARVNGMIDVPLALSSIIPCSAIAELIQFLGSRGVMYPLTADTLPGNASGRSPWVAPPRTPRQPAQYDA